MAEDYYSLLGVAKDASTQDIKKAFRQLARECHPDVAGKIPGTDPAVTAARFQQIREAYEILSDPVQRQRYDRRGERRTGPFLGSSWERVRSDPPPASRPQPPPQDLDLEDLLSGFPPADFGFGPRPGARPAPRPAPAPRRPGRDVHLTADIPHDIAERGGTVTLQYKRLRRSDNGHAVISCDEIYELRVPPQTPSGAELRVRGMGDADADGGPPGELACTVRVIPAPPRPGRMRMPRSADPEIHAGTPTDPDTVHVSVRVIEAILGGRVEVDTPAGRLRLTVPPGTDSGTRLRLRGRGALQADGSRADLYAEVQITVPKSLDAESRELLERFAELNPDK